MNDLVLKKIKNFLEGKINTKKVIELFYDIGKILDENHFSYYQIAILDMEIRKQYGLII